MNVINSQLGATTFDQLALSSIKSKNPLLLSFLLGGTAYVLLDKAIEKRGMGRSNALWNVMSSISGVTIGSLVYKEELTNKQIMGIGLGIISLYLIDGFEN